MTEKARKKSRKFKWFPAFFYYSVKASDLIWFNWLFICFSAIYSTPIAKQLAYSPAHEVSQVYSSVAAPQLAYGGHAPLAISAPAIGSSHQSTIRSHGGTISTFSKAVDTAFSSVRKSDTRISNNVYTPALATKTIAIQQPAILEQKTIPATVVSHVAFDGLGAHYAW